MAGASERRAGSVWWMVAGSVVLSGGLALALVSGATVVQQLWFVEDAVPLEAPGRYRVSAARASTWTLLQELGEGGALSAVRVKVHPVRGEGEVAVTTSALAYRYSRDGVDGFSAYDFRVAGAGDYEVELSSAQPVTLRLIDDVAERLAGARRGILRTAALAGAALALSLALFSLSWLSRRRRSRPRVMAPSQRVTTTTKPRPSTARSRGLEVLPALPTSIALERYGLPAPKKPGAPYARARVRSVA